MNRVGLYVVLGTFWVFAAIYMFMQGSADNMTSAGILIILGGMFYWSAFKMFKDPNLAKKKNKNLIQKVSDENNANSLHKKNVSTKNIGKK